MTVDLSGEQLFFPDGPDQNPPELYRSVHYLPPPTHHWTADHALAAGAAWLSRQPEIRLLYIDPAASDRHVHSLSVSRDTTVVNSVDDLDAAGLEAGSLLLAWPTRETMASFSIGGSLVRAGTRLCVMEARPSGWQSAWLRGHRAVEARHGTLFPGERVPLVSPAVEAALVELADSGAFADSEARFSRLLADGLSLPPSAVWAWALRRGATPASAERMRDSAAKATSLAIAAHAASRARA